MLLFGGKLGQEEAVILQPGLTLLLLTTELGQGGDGGVFTCFSSSALLAMPGT